MFFPPTARLCGGLRQLPGGIRRVPEWVPGLLGLGGGGGLFLLFVFLFFLFEAMRVVLVGSHMVS